MKKSPNDGNMKIAWDDSAFNSTHRKGYQSKLVVVHSKGGRCNIWGFLHCDERRSGWWASRDGPQHDRSRSDTVMIITNTNSYASFAVFFITSGLFCFFFFFLTRIYIYYKSFSCVWYFLLYVSLQSNWEWKSLKLGLFISFSRWGFLSLPTL